jgi:NADH:ubiquinone oxidoreductase subunit K
LQILSFAGLLFCGGDWYDHPADMDQAIATGIATVTFILSSVGCYGALRENSCVLYYFSVLLTILLAVQLAIIGYYHDKAERGVLTIMRYLISYEVKG